MLTFHVAQFLKEEPGAHRTVEHRGTERRLGDLMLEGPIELTADLLRTQHGILVTMPYSATITIPCGRCLNDFPLTIRDRFQDQVLAPLGESHERESNRDEDALRIGQDYILDLGEILRQELVTQIPLQPLCRDDCPGLCESCGADLQTAPCSCDQASGDSPFAALQHLFSNDSATPPQAGR